SVLGRGLLGAAAALDPKRDARDHLIGRDPVPGTFFAFLFSSALRRLPPKWSRAMGAVQKVLRQLGRPSPRAPRLAEDLWNGAPVAGDEAPPSLVGVLRATGLGRPAGDVRRGVRGGGDFAGDLAPADPRTHRLGGVGGPTGLPLSGAGL